MNDIIFEQDKPLTRPYTEDDFWNRAMKNPHLVYPTPQVEPGNWLVNLFRTRPLTRAEIVEKVAKDLFLTLEKRDGMYVFRFPDVWDSEDVEEMQTRILYGIALVERKCNGYVMIPKGKQKQFFVTSLSYYVAGMTAFGLLIAYLGIFDTIEFARAFVDGYPIGLCIAWIIMHCWKRLKKTNSMHEIVKQATPEEIVMEQKL